MKKTLTFILACCFFTHFAFSQGAGCAVGFDVTAPTDAEIDDACLNGTAFEVCITVTEFTQTSTNWMHGVFPELPAGYTVVAGSVTISDGDTNWAFFDPGPGGAPAGYYYDTDGNGNPGDNFGDSSFSGTDITGTFCFNITPPAAGCGDDVLTLSVAGDGTTGSWTNGGCDPAPSTSGEDIIPLPVEVLFFIGETYATYNKIEWATVSEINTELHILERSKDGKNDWHEVNKVAGAGNSLEEIRYEILDEQPLELSYYRLVTFDFDGTANITETIVIDRSKLGKDTKLSLSPNPNFGDLQVVFEAVYSTNTELTISDMNGKQLQKIQITTHKGENMFTLNTTNLVSGMYFLVLNDGLNRNIQRFIKR